MQVARLPDVFSMGQNWGETNKEMKRLDTLMPQSPHVVLLAIRGDQKYTQDDLQIYNRLRFQLLAKLSDNLVLAFSWAEPHLQAEGVVAQIVTRAGSFLKEVYDEARGHYLVFTNRRNSCQDEGQIDVMLSHIAKIEEEKARQAIDIGLVAATVVEKGLTWLLGTR